MVRELKKEGREKIFWFGRKVGEEIYPFRGLLEDPVSLLEKLRRGEVPPLEKDPISKENIPDLRTAAIEMARRRIREEFTDDQKLLKFLSLRIELDRLINSYFEKVLGLSFFFREGLPSSDPCGLFRKVVEVNEFREPLERIFSEGKNLCDLRSYLDDLIVRLTRKVLPNTSAITGEPLAAELLQRAGSLKRLAFMPSSTIQTLGAETALFKHMVSRTPPPKHGILFKYPGLTSLPRNKRGKASRMIAGKVSICVRADLAGHKIDTKSIKAGIQKKMNRLKGQ